MSGNTRRIVGALGGTFNPVHNGHLIVAQDAMEAFGFSKVLFVPCRIPPHKKKPSIVSPRHRLAMLQAALRGDSRFVLSDVDIMRKGVSYSVDTIRALCQREPDAEIQFIIGSDTLMELHQWKNVYDLLELCRFAIVERPGHELNTISREDLNLESSWAARLLGNSTRGHMTDISASDIRRRVAEGRSIRYLAPPPVEAYIAKHRLYRN